MRYLIHTSLLLVGNEKIKSYFQNYFRDILLVKDNIEALSICKKKYFPVVFLIDSIDIAKEVRECHRDTLIGVIVDKIDKSKLLEEGFFIRRIGYIEKPFQKKKIEKILFYIDKEIEYRNPNMVWLQNNYSFDFNSKTLYDNNHCEVKLTKKERQFLEILLKEKYQYVPNFTLEHRIWEEDALYKDCSGRLKALINGIRKKLPQNTIINEYGIGYKIAIVE